MRHRVVPADLDQQEFVNPMPTITCSAPGSIVFIGKYAVLAGYPIIVGAINQRSTVSITPIDEPILDIHSVAFGPCKIDLDTLSAPPSYQYTLASFKQFLPQLRHQGFHIRFHPDVGEDKQLGLTGAVTVALCSAFYHYIHKHLNLEDICKLASQAVLSIQVHGSCADVTASIYGGIIKYVMETKDHPALIQRVMHDLPIFAVYSGHITSESIAMHRGFIHTKKRPKLYSRIHAMTGKLGDLFFEEVQKGNLKKLGRILKLGRIVSNAYGAHTEEILEILDCLKKQETVYGAKITGAGCGGCVIGIGTVDPAVVQPYEFIPLSLASVGVRLCSPIECHSQNSHCA